MDSLRLPPTSRSSAMGSSDFGEVAALVTAYTDYLQALTGFCGRGVQLIRSFVGPCSVAYMLPSKERDDAQKAWAIWEDINKSLQQSVWSVRTTSLQSLQDWLQQRSRENSSDPTIPAQAEDLSRMTAACLLAFTQLQYQCSALFCNSFMELDMIRNEENRGAESLPSSSSFFFDSEIDKERRDSGNVSEDLTLGSAGDPLLCQLQLGRRSSYELGNLHTASPPPPNANSLGRRWSMPTEDLVLDEDKITQSTHDLKRETLVSREELDSVINLLSFNHNGAVPQPSQNKSSNFNGKSSLSPVNKQDNLQLPQLQLRVPHNKYPAHQRHEQMPLDSRSGSSSKNNLPPMNGGGLLTVASLVSPECKDLKVGRKNLGSGNSTPTFSNPSNNSKDYCSPSQQKAKLNLEAKDGVNKEGAFSIGLNLVGSNLMASVQQRQNNNEEIKSNLPQFVVPDEDKHIRLQPSLADKNWTGEQSFKETDTQSTAEFLPFSLNASQGPSIWTPSQNDYNSSGGNYYFPASHT